MRTAKTKVRKNTWVAWSEDEVKLLKRPFPRGRAREIAEQTGRPLTAVRGKASSIGLKKEKYPPWSNQEVTLLKKLYPDNNLCKGGFVETLRARS